MAKDYASLTSESYVTTSTALKVGICKGCRWLGTDLFRTHLYCNNPDVVLPVSYGITITNDIPVDVRVVRKSDQYCFWKEVKKQWFRKN